MATFLLTWDGSDAGYDPVKYAADVAVTSAGSEATGRWSMRALHAAHSAGDTVFLLRQGSQAGIVARGRLTDGLLFSAPRWDDPSREATYAYITWERVVAPADRLLAKELRETPGHSFERVQNSGHQVHPPADAALAAQWQAHVEALKPSAGPEGSLPNWTWDETVLAYEAYLSDYADPLRYPDAAHPAVRRLSTLLRQLPLHPHAVRADPRFRNPNGVARKIQNLMWEATGHTAGSANSSSMDVRVVAELTDPGLVKRIAAAIGDASSQIGDAPVLAVDGDGDGAVEGAILEYRHRRRERDRKIVQRKKDQLLRAGKPLACEACGMDVAGHYDLAAGSAVECHHLLPLASGERTTRLSDLALVCPTCHRALHSQARWPSVQALREHLQQVP